MNRCLLVVIISVMAATSVIASDWQGVEVLSEIGGNTQLSGQISLQGIWQHTEVLSRQQVSNIFYVGPKVAVLSGITLAPLVGVISDWNGRDAGLVTLWADWSSSGLGVFVEGDVYLYQEPAYYGFYSFDCSIFKTVTIGGFLEQSGLDFNAGPRLGFGNKPWRFVAQVHLGKSGYHIRFVSALSF